MNESTERIEVEGSDVVVTIEHGIPLAAGEVVEVCSKCQRPIYRDEMGVKHLGGTRFLYRDERDQSTLCPAGGEHAKATGVEA